MADDKTQSPTEVAPQWLGRPMLHQDHHAELEQAAALNEFGKKLPREQAEQAAYDEYVRRQRTQAAAHHLAGMKAAHAAGDAESARKHSLMYELHSKALGHEHVGPAHADVAGALPDQKVYRFKAHKGDLFAVDSKPKGPVDSANPEPPVTKHELLYKLYQALEPLVKALPFEFQDIDAQNQQKEEERRQGFMGAVLGAAALPKKAAIQVADHIRPEWHDYSHLPEFQEHAAGGHKLLVGHLWGEEYPRSFVMNPTNGNIEADKKMKDDFISGHTKYTAALHAAERHHALHGPVDRVRQEPLKQSELIQKAEESKTLVKGDVVKFPGNPKPAEDRGQEADVESIKRASLDRGRPFPLPSEKPNPALDRARKQVAAYKPTAREQLSEQTASARKAAAPGPRYVGERNGVVVYDHTYRLGKKPLLDTVTVHIHPSGQRIAYFKNPGGQSYGRMIPNPDFPGQVSYEGEPIPPHVQAAMQAALAHHASDLSTKKGEVRMGGRSEKTKAQKNKQKPCLCSAFHFPHRAGGGKCSTR